MFSEQGNTEEHVHKPTVVNLQSQTYIMCDSEVVFTIIAYN
jgi:hypothetical protein